MEFENKTILVVDSDRSTSRAFKRILQKAGFTVDSSSEGYEAVEKIKNNNYSAVLISLWLPDIDGFDMLLFAKKSLPNALKVVATGFPSLSNMIKAMELGADAVFAKPIQPEKLVWIIEQALKKNQTNNDFVT
jgi:two-component system response regulator HydG